MARIAKCFRPRPAWLGFGLTVRVRVRVRFRVRVMGWENHPIDARHIPASTVNYCKRNLGLRLFIPNG